MALFGYAFYRAFAYNSYTTGFSLADEQVGYIFNITFILTASIGLLAVALPLSIYYWRTPYKPLTVTYTVPMVALLVCYVFIWVVQPLFDRLILIALLGLIWGAATVILSIAWLEVLALDSSPLVLVFQLAFASLVSAAIGMLLPASLVPANSILCCVLLIASMVMLRYCRRKTVPFEPLPLKSATTQALRQALIPLVGCLLFEMIIGMVNMYVVASQSVSFITADTPIQGMILCAVFAFLFVLSSIRMPNPSIIYLVIFPVMIAVFLLLPFFGSSFGPQISPWFYAGYIFTTIIARLYYLRACLAFRARLYFVILLVSGMTRIALVIGLSLGYVFGNLSLGDEAMYLTFIAVACVYLLGIAVVTWALRSAREPREAPEAGTTREGSEAGEAGEAPEAGTTREAGDAGAMPEAGTTREAGDAGTMPEAGTTREAPLEDALCSRIEVLRTSYHLTPRECDVLARLALGYSAATIAEELVVATSTVNGYIKSIYVKLGVNRKQQVIDLFNDILITPEPFKLVR